MTNNHLFPSRIILYMKGKTNTRAAFKAESKEVDKHFYKKEYDRADFQAVFQIEVQYEPGYGISYLDIWILVS